MIRSIVVDHELQDDLTDSEAEGDVKRSNNGTLIMPRQVVMDFLHTLIYAVIRV